MPGARNAQAIHSPCYKGALDVSLWCYAREVDETLYQVHSSNLESTVLMDHHRVRSPSDDSRKSAPIKAPVPRSVSGRSRKIARIRKAIVDGSYDVPASDVADKLMDQMLERRSMMDSCD